MFILKLAKALLSFGAPSHRIESQLAAASDILDAQAGQYTVSRLSHLRLSTSTRKNLFIFQTSLLLRSGTGTQSRRGHTLFALLAASLWLLCTGSIWSTVRYCTAKWEQKLGPMLLDNSCKLLPYIRLSLDAPWLSSVLLSYASSRSVDPSLICGSVGLLQVSSNTLAWMLRTKARCMPMFTSRFSVRSFLKSLILSRISVSIVVAFVARGLSNIPGYLFCYSAVSSAGVVVILPGFTICELRTFFDMYILNFIQWSAPLNWCPEISSAGRWELCMR